MTYNCLIEVTFVGCDDEFFSGAIAYVSRAETET